MVRKSERPFLFLEIGARPSAEPAVTVSMWRLCTHPSDEEIGVRHQVALVLRKIPKKDRCSCASEEGPEAASRRVATHLIQGPLKLPRLARACNMVEASLELLVQLKQSELGYRLGAVHLAEACLSVCRPLSA